MWTEAGEVGAWWSHQYAAARPDTHTMIIITQTHYSAHATRPYLWRHPHHNHHHWWLFMSKRRLAEPRRWVGEQTIAQSMVVNHVGTWDDSIHVSFRLSRLHGVKYHQHYTDKTLYAASQPAAKLSAICIATDVMLAWSQCRLQWSVCNSKLEWTPLYLIGVSIRWCQPQPLHRR